MTEVIQIPRASDSTQPGVLSISGSTYRDPEDVLRVYLSALTGLDKELVRKRWTQKPGTRPKVGTDWAAVGIDRVRTEGFPYQHGRKPQEPSDPDVNTRTSWQTLHCIASFYGPHAAELSDGFRESIQLPQNNTVLKGYGLTIQAVDDEVAHVPEFAFEQWIDRYDVFFRLGRSVTRTYGVRTIVSAEDIQIITERGKA